MSKKRLPAHIIEADRDLIETLQDLTDYAPRDPDHSLAAMQTLGIELSAKYRERRRLDEMGEQLDDEIIELEYLYHDRALGVKDEAIGQYGRNSPALKAVGLKPRARGRKRTPSP
jgi:uncharacterized protein YbcC (UPF0753/DUF2309 family)